ncbi:alginate lyase domain-containing protein, partial [Syncephalastrum racemosum]
NDYVSLARYFWPNNSTANGLPYIRRDGYVNPDIKKVPDYDQFRDAVQQIQYLSLAYHYFDNTTYAQKASKRVADWFINPKSRMNPHLQYASLVRGYDSGRAKGIIDLHVLPDLLDAIAILQHSPVWPKGYNAQLRWWTMQYIRWLRESPNGQFEQSAHNNHGTFYDVQLASLYLFLGDKHNAREVINNATALRIAPQISTTGEQYQETARPFSWFYSIFNLQGLIRLAEIGRQVGVDLYTYQTVDGKGVRPALDFLLPYALNETAWPFSNVDGFNAS